MEISKNEKKYGNYDFNFCEKYIFRLTTDRVILFMINQTALVNPMLHVITRTFVL